MVDAVLDPVRMPTISLSDAEIGEIEALMQTGALPKDFLDRYFAAVEANVFGVDHKKDRHGNPIEQGIGSPGNMTKNSISAYKRYAKYDSDFNADNFAANVKAMEAQLEACNETRAASNAARRKKGAGK